MAALGLFTPAVFADEISSPSFNGPGDPAVALRDYSPGIRIDWPRRLVELDATVVLRAGALELLACSPNTREHESILAVTGRPRDVYHAMGLVGLRSGSPVRYDRKLKRVLPPTGESLRLDIRYRVEGTERTMPAEHWLLDTKRRSPIESVNWVFAGSATIHDGRFGADVDGTVVCVVDFDTALIAVGESHSADNALLWLEANTREIPPIGTKCILVIRSAEPQTVEIEVATDGILRRDGRAVTAEEIARLVSQRAKDPSDATTIILRPTTTVTDQTIAAIVDALVRAGVDRGSIGTLRSAPPPSSGPVPRSPIGGAMVEESPGVHDNL